MCYVSLAAAKSNLGKESLRGDGRHWQIVKIVVRAVIVTMAERMDAAPGEIKSAVDDVAADNVALIEKNLSAKETHDSGTRMDGDQRIAVRIFHHWAVAMLQMDHGEIAIGAHFVAGGVYQHFIQLGARKLANGVDATSEREIADKHVDAIVEIAINVVDKVVILDRESGAGLSGVGA